MAGGSSSGGGGGGGVGSGALTRIIAAITAAGGAGLIGFMIWNGGGGGGGSVSPTAQVQLPPTVRAVTVAVPTAGATSSAVFGPAAFDREALKEGNPDAVVLTITAYGLPARVSAQVTDSDNQKIAQGYIKSCAPEDLFPEPCVSYWVVKRGATVTVTAGDSLAGYWPNLDAVTGPGCNLSGGGTDQTCTLNLLSDVDLTAVYSGGESPGLAHYQYPTCPTQRQRPPSWASRCR